MNLEKHDLRFLITSIGYIAILTLLGAQNNSLKIENRHLKENRIIIHQVDNAGGVMVGKVTSKEVINGHHTVTAGAYGTFLVTEEQYNTVAVGDDIPDYLKGRGN